MRGAENMASRIAGEVLTGSLEARPESLEGLRIGRGMPEGVKGRVEVFEGVVRRSARMAERRNREYGYAD